MNTNQIIHERLMGECWHDIVESNRGYTYDFECTKCDYSEAQSDVEKDDINPKYDSDLNLAFAAQAKAIERFGESAFTAALRQIVLPNESLLLGGLVDDTKIAKLINSNAPTRCAAIVKLLENEK